MCSKDIQQMLWIIVINSKSLGLQGESHLPCDSPPANQSTKLAVSKSSVPANAASTGFPGLTILTLGLDNSLLLGVCVLLYRTVGFIL